MVGPQEPFMADPIKASFDIPFQNPFGTVPAAQQGLGLIQRIGTAAFQAKAIGMAVGEGSPRWDRGREGRGPAWPDRPWWGYHEPTTLFIPTIFGIRHHHPSAPSPSGPARRDHSPSPRD